VIILETPAETESAGAALASWLRAGDIVALSGELGAGKTSFARGVLMGLGLSEEAPSPTFPIVIPYAPPLVRLSVWHVDLYRLESDGEALGLGLDDALIDGCLLIEWPERLGRLQWPDALKLRFDHLPSGGRSLTETVPPSWEGRCPFQ
jgi:tRNA threonylcarbamoyladenosine biosynthesis protein TsaE